ncbi:MAG TPA: VOC family protein [Solirubrobacteraceae bacterium]|nr:VOC family protein [Solirubrobacteraceae bacterium]
MSVTDVNTNTVAETPELSPVDMNLEVVTLPVSDIDRAKRFYQSLGWRLDIDLVIGDSVRSVQFTPPHSATSIQFGKGRTTAAPGSAQRLVLVVTDIDAAREELISRGVDVSEVVEQRPPGFGSPGRSYFATASFSDPDGNSWLLQEITTRLPGREWEDQPADVASLADLLRETAEHHGLFEAVSRTTGGTGARPTRALGSREARLRTRPRRPADTWLR